MDSLSPESFSRQGHAALRIQDYKSAATYFRRAIDLDRARNKRMPEMRYLSYYGLSLAHAGLSHKVAIEACGSAVARQRKDPVLFLNLGRVYRLAGKRTLAMKAFESGLEINPDHPMLQRELGRLDRRSKPVIPFVDRSHPVNRWLGQLRSTVRHRSH
jgi:tetratricopeptide (TPR) repeat protein